MERVNPRILQTALTYDPVSHDQTVPWWAASARSRPYRPTMRHQIGLRHPIAKDVDAQILYMRQQNFRDGRPDVVSYVPWLTLSWRI